MRLEGSSSSSEQAGGGSVEAVLTLAPHFLFCYFLSVATFIGEVSRGLLMASCMLVVKAFSLSSTCMFSSF